MMHMTFYWGNQVTILFDGWTTSSWISYSLSLLACFLVSTFYQYLEDKRVRFKLVSAAKASNPPKPQIEDPLLQQADGKTAGSKWSAARFAGASLFGLNSGIGYLLMLAVMSFNGGVFVAIVLGLAVGYLFFRSGDEDVATLVVDNPCACS
nr:copper transporter 5.1-like [Quercus suber]POE59534.1 copper transporter 5 [Quercus suber]